ncbi:MAG: hypothetical protein PHV30_09140 [Candidatus Margulisbacteria bacterium]|nr:hypothetical protein [Candidatus Margulisiibacteriota bacterium]
MRIVTTIKIWLVALWNAFTEMTAKFSGVYEQARLFFLANLYSAGVKRMIGDQSAMASMSIAEEFIELGIGAVVAGTFEFYGIGMMINYSFPPGTSPIVTTLATVFLGLMFVIADVLIIVKYVKMQKSTGRYR